MPCNVSQNKATHFGRYYYMGKGKYIYIPN